MKRLHINIQAELKLDDEAEQQFEELRKEFPGDENDWLDDRLRSEQGAQIMSYDLEYRETKS